MRKFLVLVILLLVGGVLVFNGLKEKVKRDLAQPLAQTQPTLTKTPDASKYTATRKEEDTTSLFVPYWTVANGEMDASYDTYLYFGVTPGSTGINRNESGYAQLDAFTAQVPAGKEKLLVLRMLDNDSNSAILKSSAKQNSLIRDTVVIAKENGFDGVVVDLELSAIPFESLVSQISEFNKRFSAEVKQNKLSYGITIYGDTFYRLRPFDVKMLAQHTDMMYIMAYDFHKSRGNPGPNFPLNGRDKYGYDMAKMSDDFLEFVPPEKLAVIFGLFGYDWKVDGKGTATARGEAMTNNETRQKFAPACQYENCFVQRDDTSKETHVNYTDENGVKHKVWFEDMQSVEAKQEHLRQKGISAFSFWANGYF